MMVGDLTNATFGKLHGLSPVTVGRQMKRGFCSWYRRLGDGREDNLAAVKKYHKTVKGWFTSSYAKMFSNGKQRGLNTPDFTKEQFIEFVLGSNQWNFMQLYEKWAHGGYQKFDRPSVDRLNNYKGYDLSNLRIVTWRQNLDARGSIMSDVARWRRSKLKREDILEIKKRLEAGDSPEKISLNYPVSSSSIYMIRKGATWGDVYE